MGDLPLQHSSGDVYRFKQACLNTTLVPFTLCLELGQRSEPAGVISTLILCGEGGNPGSGELTGKTQRHLRYSNST